MKNKFIYLFLTLLMVGQFAKGQEKQRKDSKGVVGPDGFVRCSFVEMDEDLQKNHPKEVMSKEAFEQWIAPKVAKYKADVASGKIKRDEVFTIPVVIHVIHNGDAINTVDNATSENISYAQAVSQINVLNQDYRRMAGTPGAEVTGYGLGVDVQIQFCLASRDPNGFPTDGVDRVNLGQESWSTSDIESTVKPETIWDPTKYLNMWSVNFSNSSLLGYAQFPTESGLDGLDESGMTSTANTDGVVSNYNAFGTIAEDDGSFILNTSYNLGRTMTHEVGHWLGLRHIWGDGDCDADDYCEDTPNAEAANYSCADEVTSCDSVDMTENYMDYTYDYCMNTFTEDQKARMVTVMTLSPRRASLATSNGCDAPEEYGIEAGIESNGVSYDCSGEATQSVVITNYGEQDATSIIIEYGIENSTASYTWTGSLSYLETATVELPSVTLSDGSNSLIANIVSVNGSTDEYADNNNTEVTTIEYTTPTSYTTNVFDFELQLDRYGGETSWELVDSSGSVIYSGDDYDSAGSSGDMPEPITETWTLNENECYIFTIYDSYGDGINSTSYGEGYVKLTETSSGTEVFNITVFEDSESSSFSIGSLATTDIDANAFSVYPNPAKTVLNLNAGDAENVVAYSIYNTNGQIVSQFRNAVPKSAQEINVAGLKPGVYFLEVTLSDKKEVVKFIKK